MTYGKIKSRGRMTLHKELRDANDIRDGDTILLVDADDGVIILKHQTSQVDRIADKIAAEFRSNGITLEDALEELKRIRSKYK
jgi:bifunctional DNA-binding transcriptional regulator/antitoxin component of YhaV-PrlF toxin-antitoxin module